MGSWLVTVAQLPTEDPAARMRVLRTLESLGAAVMREGAYLLPDTSANRQALEALSEYIGKSAGSAQVLNVSAASAAQQQYFERLLDRSARYEELIKTVQSLRVGFGHSDPSAISRVLHKQRREFEAIAALDFFPTLARSRAERALIDAEAAVREQRYANEAAAHYGLADALLRAGRVAEAQAELQRLRALGVASPMIETLAARVAQAGRDAAGAKRILTEAHKRYPYSRALAYAYIGALQESGANDAALAALGDSLKLYPRDSRLYALQAKTYSALGKRLLQHSSQGEAYALQGSLPAAIEQFQLARSAGDGDFYQLSVVDARLKELRSQHALEMKDAKR